MAKKSLQECSIYDLDPATGLPELPEGYFWRVRDAHYKGSAYVELRSTYEVRWLFFWKKTHSTKIHEELILAPITRPRILKEAEDTLIAVQKNLISDYSLLGDYPPKSLYA